MILPLFRRSRQDDSIDRLYGAIVAQARLPAFYAIHGVPDTVDGRVELIVLHAVLLLHRLGRESAELRAVGQAVFDRFCQDMDDNLREMGIGDLAVPRQMQRIAGVFYGRAAAYEAALAAADPSHLVMALRRNIYPDGPAAEVSAERLAVYVRDAVAQLRDHDSAALLEGRLSYPDPSVVTETAAKS